MRASTISRNCGISPVAYKCAEAVDGLQCAGSFVGVVEPVEFPEGLPVEAGPMGG